MVYDQPRYSAKMRLTGFSFLRGITATVFHGIDENLPVGNADNLNLPLQFPLLDE